TAALVERRDTLEQSELWLEDRMAWFDDAYRPDFVKFVNAAARNQIDIIVDLGPGPFTIE
ncbi:MAG: hypothetical protein GYB68_11090, partial [Chloroflexi bacterium]|nr:hypothetical protein [Chloroflexota bacterium]